ncbi:MAG TPA: hypothetical protein VFJ16_12965 [Longimicrobium sp.]|nr:hypothetical protein [Longimicrobium sp.]
MSIETGTGVDTRAAALAAHGASGGEIDELLAYAENAFSLEGAPALPLDDEPCAAAWEGYAARASEIGVVPALREVLPQLRFPIQAGIAATDAYRAATLRGEAAEHPGGGVEFHDEAGVRLFMHPTPAGRIAVIVARARADFESLIRALTRRNEPEAVPASMGACIVGGYNDWARVAALRAGWERENPAAAPGAWGAFFRERVVPRRELYQDRFIILSSGPYSAVSASDLGMEEAEWAGKSLAIRLEHECAHYVTRRVFGSMRNSLHDELIADWRGIRAAEGRFRADWLLRFMGLENHPEYRQGGRLQNYRGTPPLSDGAFAALRSMLVAAAATLEAVDASIPREPAAEARALCALAALSVEELAGPGAVERFHAAYAAAGAPEPAAA